MLTPEIRDSINPCDSHQNHLFETMVNIVSLGSRQKIDFIFDRGGLHVFFCGGGEGGGGVNLTEEDFGFKLTIARQLPREF